MTKNGKLRNNNETGEQKNTTQLNLQILFNSPPDSKADEILIATKIPA